MRACGASLRTIIVYFHLWWGHQSFPISDCKQSSLRVIHLRTECASQVLLTGVSRAGELQNFSEDPPEAVLRQVALLRVNHLRTEDASEVLLEGVTRAGEGIMVSPAHLMCPTGTSDWGYPRR